jgi:hypothetical protein
VLVRHSVHSKVMMILAPFLLAIIAYESNLSIGLLDIDTQITIFAYYVGFEQLFFLILSREKNL